MAPPTQDPSRLSRGVTWGVLAIIAAPRLWAALFNHGLFWADEIFQTLEPAHRLVFGHGLQAWEFRDGVRSWALPGVYAGIFEAASRLGVSSGIALVCLARLATVAMALLGAWAALRIAEHLAGPRAAVLSGVIAATFPPALVLAHRCTSEGVAAAFVALGVLLVYRERFIAAGLAVGVAFVLRNQNGLVALFYLVQLVGQRRLRARGAWLAAGGAAAVLAGGLLDWATWGRPFASIVGYLQFNLSASAVTSFGASPADYYLRALWTSCGPILVPLAILFAIGLCTRARGPGILVLIYVAVHSAIPHKELRFLVGIFPLACAVFGVGAAEMMKALGRRGPAVVGVVVVAICGIQGWWASRLTHADMGEPLFAAESV